MPQEERQKRQTRSSSSRAVQEAVEEAKRTKLSNSESAAAAPPSATAAPKSGVDFLLIADALLERVTTLEESTADIVSKRKALRRDMKNFNLKASEFKKLKDEITSLQEIVTNKESSNVKLETEIAALKDAITSRAQSNAELNKTNGDLIKEVGGLKMAQSEAVRESARIMKMFESESKEKITALQTELDAKSGLHAALVKKDSEQKEELAAAATQVDTLKRTISTLRGDAAASTEKSQAQVVTITRLQKKLQDSEELVKNLRKQIEDNNLIFTNTLGLKQQRLAHAEQAIDQWVAYKNACEQKERDLNQQISGLNQQINGLQTCIQEQSEVIVVLKSIRPNTGPSNEPAKEDTESEDEDSDESESSEYTDESVNNDNDESENEDIYEPANGETIQSAPLGFSEFFAFPSIGNGFNHITDPSSAAASQLPPPYRYYVSKTGFNA